MNKLVIAIVILAFSHTACAVNLSRANKTIGVWTADAIIERHQPTINVLTKHGWDHSNSIVLHGIEKIYRQNPKPSYLAYIKGFADDYVNEDGTITGLLTTLDGIHPGVVCLFLYEITGQQKYRLAAKTMRDHIMGNENHASVFAKTPDGVFWHKNNVKYKNVASVDGLYMKDPFLVRYGLTFNEPNTVDMALNQVLLVSARSFNIKNNLAFHAWSYEKSKPWSDPITGQATQHWSRASGWFSMALVDILEYLPQTHPKYSKIHTLFKRVVLGITQAQNPKTGLWYQVLDKYEQKGNYPEVSGSGMMIYAIKKGIDLGLISDDYLAAATAGWQGLNKYIKVYSDNGPQVTSVAPGMSSQNNYQAYVDIAPISVPRAQVKQYSHGYVGVLMAASVMESFD